MKPMRLRRYTWSEFERAVRILRHDPRLPWGDGIRMITGEPRGGLPLAVALSHVNAVQFSLRRTGTGILWVDDIYDSGMTYRARGKQFYEYQAVWLRREGVECPCPYVDTLEQGAWAVFPWEDVVKAQRDMEAYNAKRAAEQSGEGTDPAAGE